METSGNQLSAGSNPLAQGKQKKNFGVREVENGFLVESYGYPNHSFIAKSVEEVLSRVGNLLVETTTA